jgi:hypothetical protein
MQGLTRIDKTKLSVILRILNSILIPFEHKKRIIEEVKILLKVKY